MAEADDTDGAIYLWFPPLILFDRSSGVNVTGQRENKMSVWAGVLWFKSL